MPLDTAKAIVGAAIAVAGVWACTDRPDSGPRGTPAPVVQRELPPPASTELGPRLVTAFRLIEAHRTETARADLGAYLEEFPDDGKAEFLLGLSYHREKRYSLARPHFARAVALEPGYHPAYHFQGWCLYWLGELPAAREAFEKHLHYTPDEGDSHFAIGLIDLDEDRLDEAAGRFRRAIALQKDTPQRRKDVAKAHARLGDIHIRRDELEEARTQLQTATELWPEHYTAFYKLSRVLTRLGEPEAAAEAFRQYRVYEQRVAERRGIPGAPP